MRHILFMFSLLALVLGIGHPIHGLAQISKVFTYQGRLSDNNLPAVGSFDFEIRLYDALTAGNLLLTSTQAGIQVVDGVFSVRIDFASVPDLFDDKKVWAEVSVNNAGQTVQTLSPRTEVTPATQATYAVKAGSLLNSLPSFLGASTSTVQGQEGFFALMQACLDSFPGSRVCTSRDIVSLTAVPVLNSAVWVQPSAQDFEYAGGSPVAVDGASGVFYQTTVSENATLSCQSWSSTSGKGLIIVRTNFFKGFSTSTCGSSLPVACCTGPTP